MAIALVQSSSDNRTGSKPSFSLPGSPAEGSLLILATENEGGYTLAPSGWTTVMTRTTPYVFTTKVLQVHVRQAEAAEPDTWALIGDYAYSLSEWSDAAFDRVVGASAAGSLTVGQTIVPSDTGVDTLIFGAATHYHAYSMTGSAGYTELHEIVFPDAGRIATYYKLYASGTASASLTVTGEDGVPEDNVSEIILLSVLPGAGVPPPDPEPGAVIDPPGEVDPDPVPITEDIVEWTIRRGAAEQVTGAAPIGSATVKLRNSIATGADSDNKYNPENASSPLTAYLHDGTGIHIAVNKTDGLLTGTDPAGLFGGRITDITPMPMGGQMVPPFVEFQCEDALGWLGRTPLTIGFATGRSQGDLRLAILNAADETRYELANEILTMPLSAGEGNALELLESLNRANGTRHFVRPATAAADWYTYVSYNRQHGLEGGSDAALTDDEILVSGIAGWRLSADSVVNQQKASTTPIRFTPSTYTVWAQDPLPLSVTTTRPFEVWVEFDDYVKAPNVNSAYSGSTPTITLTPFGTTAKLTITVASGTCTFTQLRIEGSLARRLPAVSWVADDPVSQVLPRGVRSGSEISGEYVGTLSTARGIAEHVVWRYADPLTRPTLTIANWFPEMFDLDIGDMLSVTFDHVGVTAQRFEIIGLTHHGVFITTDRSLHTVEYVLQKSRVQADPGWFVLDTSELDSADVLAY